MLLLVSIIFLLNNTYYKLYIKMLPVNYLRIYNNSYFYSKITT